MSCPSKQVIHELARSELDQDRASKTLSHISGCERCRDILHGFLSQTVAAPPSIAEGKRLGEYELQELLGEGGMGTVYRALDRRLERTVAIKVAQPHIAASPRAHERFLREARAMAAVKNDHVTTIYSVEEHNEIPFLAMELLEGESLHAAIKRGWQPTTAEIVRIAREIATGLAATHERGLVHRDVKPSNIWLETDGRVKILDFGIARAAEVDEDLTLEGYAVGSPRHMAPEQLEGSDIDARADLFALGGVLYLLCTGQLPFDGSSMAQVIMGVCHLDPKPMEAIAPDLPEALVELVGALLAKDPHERPASARNVIERLESIEGVLAPDGEGPVRRGAERRRVTVLQLGCDLYESDEIAESLDPEEQQELLRSFQDLCRGVVRELDGAIVHETTNGLLACFGFPRAFEDSAHQAVRAGLALLARLGALNEELERGKRVRLGGRALVHTGRAVVEDRSGEGPSIVGRVRNVVEKLEGFAPAATVIVTDETWRHVRGFFTAERIALGFPPSLGVETFSVTEEKTAGSRIDVALPGELTPLIGRAQEVGLLQDRWEHATEGMGQIVLLIGDAGLGKSRLVHTLKEHVAEPAQDAWIVEWRCTPHHRTSTLHPAIDHFARLLGGEGAGPPTFERVVRHLEEVGIEGEEPAALLASLLAIDPPRGTPHLSLSPRRQKEKTLELLLDWLRALARQRPVLFIVEDLHWIDPTTLELLQRHVDGGFGDRILTVASFRPEFETPWRSKGHQTQVALNRLTKRQIGELMGAKLSRAPDPELVARVAARTDGVPLFVEELTRMLIESGEDAAMGDHAIPATLQDLLVARLDRLVCDVGVVQLAAVIGREVPWALLSAASPLHDDRLRGELGKLVEAELLYRRGRDDYAFKHALLLDAAYESLVRKKREQLHRSVATEMERVFPEKKDDAPEVLARHFDAADMPERAVHYYELAGTRSLSRSAHAEAIVHLRRGLEIVGHTPPSRRRTMTEIRLLTSLGVPLQSTRGYGAPEVERSYNRAFDLCTDSGVTAQLFPVLYGLFRYSMLQARYPKAEELGKRLVALADESGDAGDVVAAHRALGGLLVYRGEPARAMRHLETVLAVEATPERVERSMQTDVADPWVTSHAYRSWALWLLGDPEAARAESDRAIRLAEEREHPFSVALALSFAQWSRQFAGDIEGTREAAERALALSEEHGFEFWVGWCRVLLGHHMSRAGDHVQAATEIREGIDEWRRQGSELGTSYFYALLAEARAAAGAHDEALEALSMAERFARRTGEGYWLPEVLRQRGELQRASGDQEEAVASFEAAMALAREQGAVSLVWRAERSLNGDP